jgi:bifunctional pyridoxal-dependent enzyme with beta-cystathionase and maltose regulon repressor activities
VINPGNPTGSILSEETIRKIIEFSVKNKIVLIADEVIVYLFRFIEKIYTKMMLLLYLSEKS